MPAQEPSGPTLLHNLGAGLEAVTSTPSHVVALDASSEHGPSEDEVYSVVSSVSPVTTQPPPNADAEQEPHLAPKTGKCSLLLYVSVSIPINILSDVLSLLETQDRYFRSKRDQGSRHKKC